MAEVKYTFETLGVARRAHFNGPHRLFNYDHVGAEKQRRIHYRHCTLIEAESGEHRTGFFNISKIPIRIHYSRA